MKTPKPLPPALQKLSSLAKLMDSKFRVPGTDIRFGLDALIGLVPGAGDLTTFGISGYMLWVMANNGASGFVLARMILNVLIDTLVGAIPILGDLFDVAFKSNIRNMRLMEQHYTDGRHNGSAWKVIIPVLLILFIFIAGIVYLVWIFVAWLWSKMHGW
ncbi:MAG: DUF4112 domain-containing protein [Ferruginibacter sp.]